MDETGAERPARSSDAATALLPSLLCRDHAAALVSPRNRTRGPPIAFINLHGPCPSIIDGSVLDHHRRFAQGSQPTVRKFCFAAFEGRPIMNPPTLGELLHSFFENHLKCQKGLRLTSVRSYRDGMSLFLQSVAKQSGRKLSALTITDLTCERVLAFLNELEAERHNHIRTRNQRLAALRTFFEYVVHRMPEGLKEAERITAIPMKRVAPPETCFLDRDEVQSLFAS